MLPRNNPNLWLLCCRCRFALPRCKGEVPLLPLPAHHDAFQPTAEGCRHWQQEDEFIFFYLDGMPSTSLWLLPILLKKACDCATKLVLPAILRKQLRRATTLDHGAHALANCT